MTTPPTLSPYRDNFHAALHYRELGLSVVPIGKNKKPLIKWKEFQKRLATPDEIKDWFQTMPNVQVGIVTGAISRIVVVDVEAGGSTDGVPTTVSSRTGGGGWHFYFQYPDFPVANSVKVVRDLTDIRGDGGYIIAPPALHLSGKRYAWEVPFARDALVPLPDWVLEQVRAGASHVETGQAKMPHVDGKVQDWQALLEEDNPQGSRNMTAAQLAGKLLYHLPPELWEVSGWQTMLRWNSEKNTPPLPAPELRAVWESIGQKEAGKRKARQQRKVQKQEKAAAPDKPSYDVSTFKTLSSNHVADVLGLTIKEDRNNKLVTFLCQLSAFTENSQFNVSFNAPSSTGKSYIPIEIAQLFPASDVVQMGYCSPTAFFHDAGKYNKETNTFEIDLARKILIFLDQPHMQLLERLRPLLSHDEKEMRMKITDKSDRGGLRTKNVILRGYPSVIFCSAGLRIDEQESTRFLLLSPETSQEKLQEAIRARVQKESDMATYASWLDANPERKLLKERIAAIKDAGVANIIIPEPEKVQAAFLENKKILKPRHQRDIGRLIAITKIFALLNLWFRERRGNTIIANDDDLKEALGVWRGIAESQEYNLPPYIFALYHEVILAAFRTKNGAAVHGTLCGLSRQEIIAQHTQVYGRTLPDWQLRQQIIPMLETAGLVYQEPEANDRRKLLLYPQKL